MALFHNFHSLVAVSLQTRCSLNADFVENEYDFKEKKLTNIQLYLALKKQTAALRNSQ